MDIRVLPLGAGQDVGRSCVLVTLAGRTIMFDCGIHMGYNDERRFPDFKYISRSGNYTEAIDAVIITHFHLDHCGALAYFTEVHGYNGPIFMTHPTKALIPLMLEDFRKVLVDRLGENEHFNSRHIKNCMKKVIALDLMETYKVDDELEIRAYYAGHVLGAAMFYARVGDQEFGPSVVYTGDYNMTPDRHLGAAQIDRCRPDLLITESTYATTIRDSKRARERDFVQQVHECIKDGGKVLIPVFALGRAQELAILVEEYWERVGLTAPIYFSAGLTAKANLYYKLLINWTSAQVKASHERGTNMFDFRHVAQFERAHIEKPGPCVLFASPGMLHAGMSLEVFKSWGSGEKNMVILPGYCVAGTVGAKLIAGHRGPLEIDKRCTVDVQCKVRYLSFSAHADAKGIMQLIRQAAPKNVLLVHGEKAKMDFLKAKISSTLGIPCYNPPNGEVVRVAAACAVKVHVSQTLLQRSLAEHASASITTTTYLGKRTRNPSDEQVGEPVDVVPVEGVLVSGGGSALQLKLLDNTEVAPAFGIVPHALSFGCTLRCCRSTSQRAQDGAREIGKLKMEADASAALDASVEAVRSWLPVEPDYEQGVLRVGSFEARFNVVGSSQLAGTGGEPEISPVPSGSPATCSRGDQQDANAGGEYIEVACQWKADDAPMAERAISLLRQSISDSL
ncbi:Integrator complex subunit 11 [Cymbomonas tetramitiformis]|uniref:Integrator complex subunit 11 n=1 Tax=Cymbomonas tetramitiformis TaxID=36881 RepID=A0AAE0C331_9CHLO|nr:Integrator complex subunit 11 [Cymbomonas tetramitiformis]